MFIKKFAIAALAASVSLMSGCAVFKSDRLAKVSAQELRSAAPVKTKVYSNWKVLNTAGLPISNADAAKIGADNLKKRFNEALAAADCCIVVDNAKDADLVVEGHNRVEDHSVAHIGALITGFSLFVIPSWATIDLDVTATAKTASATRTYHAQDSTTMVMWLPMVLAMPFTGNPITVGESVERNVFETIVVKIKGDGLLK